MDQKNPFYRYLNNSLSEKEKSQLDSFFERESLRIKEWDEESMGNKELVSDRIWSKILKTGKKERKPTLVSRISLEFAAIVLLLIFGGMYVLINQSSDNGTDQDMWKEYHTVAGQRSTITLPDGSTVILNSASKLSHPHDFQGSARRVKLEGEAFFDVSHDRDRPFIVVNEQFTTQVLGTEFNVKSYAKERSSVSVKSGKVLVQQRIDSGKIGLKEVILYPNESAYIDVNDGGLTKDKADLKEDLAWISGEIYLKEMSLDDLSKILERTYAVKVNFQTPELKQCRISGKLGRMNISQIMEVISSTMGLQYEMSNRRISITGKACKTTNKQEAYVNR
ncbi:FecR domain-containing protein [Algoriphagus sp. AGSA1]|uniref:FecR family protein n=1 Tax=Algoriphagus sp. AGSA1 TaxID=2907213 RepID=UPI001F3D6FC1|nr:FecR domain-containing protein [Algoriphagus sp. AGSA1]MCE7055192.1 FecR domain-containing protein [Algoriphagus sp. AGSA1]